MMKTHDSKATTAVLAEWATSFKLGDAPASVVDRMKALVLDLLRVIAVGARLPWSRAARRIALDLGGTGTGPVLLCGSKLDAARAAFVNGAYAHACDLDDTHVGSMHHPGASILPAVLAMGEREDAFGAQLLEAAICGYEASLRIGLAVQPSMFQRGFMATPTCGTLGAALAAGKLLKLSANDMAGALGAASNYAGGLAQFYKSGSMIKRTNGARGAESGVMAALLTQAGIWGPRDILEGEAGFFRAFADKFDASQVTHDLGRDYRLMQVSTKIHAGAGRLQAAVDAGLALSAENELTCDNVADVEVGIPKVIQGRLTQAAPPDLQSAQLSVPFALAIALDLGKLRGPQASLRREDYEAALGSPAVRALSSRVRCVLDAQVEAGTNTEEVPARVKVTLTNGKVLNRYVEHPRGSPHRQMVWDEVAALFEDAVKNIISTDQIKHVLSLVAALDRDTRARELASAFIALPQWLNANILGAGR